MVDLETPSFTPGETPLRLAYESDVEASRPGVHRSAFGSGVLLSLTNPQNVAYWAALGSALGSAALKEPKPADYAVFLRPS
jgi:chemosensory pili system protein ChpE/L-lysine exporter family protein LysE/ArgO